MKKELASFASTISNYLKQFSEEDCINIYWLQRIIEVNINRKVSEQLIIDYLREKGFHHYILSETTKKEACISPKYYEKIVKKDIGSLKDVDDEDFDPNLFLEENKKEIQGSMLPTKNFEDNIWLIEKYQQTESIEFLSQIITLNHGLIEQIAGKYSNSIRHKLDFDDLISAGKFGMIKAVEKFDPNMGYQFSTYATWWIRQVVTRTIMDEGTTIRVPVHVHEKIQKLIKKEKECFKLKNEIVVAWICEQLEITEETYFKLKQVDENFLGMVSLNSIVSQEGEDSMLIDFIEYGPDHVMGEIHTELLNPLEGVLRKNLKMELEKMLVILTEKEREVVKHRVGFDNGIPKTLEEIGRIFGVTRERIRQIEAKALKKLEEKFRKMKINYEDISLEA
ncbi:RNA polymerase sigma factor RpoD/SigA [Cytobacillus firmus]|uniref:sigma-70 family RNA polymerase sigma factor n=1 Tax=Cytobacillus firmus TaxID=1399 RepID=UPI0036BA99B0